MQSLIVRILASKKLPFFEVFNPYGLLSTMIWQLSNNHHRVNKKYAYISSSNEDISDDSYFETVSQNSSPCTYVEDIEYSLSLREIKKMSADLPKKQREAILNALAGNDVGEGIGENPSLEPQYESKKTNKRLAIAKLREKVG